MRTTPPARAWLDPLHPASAILFAAIVVFGVVLANGPAWDSFAFRVTARLAGYLGFALMLVPYLHILRRRFHYRRGWTMRCWMRWHVGAAYVAFLMVLVHSRGQANGVMTLVLLWLTWAVMLSGAVGYFGQKLLYYLLPFILTREYGMERLGAEREQLLQEAAEIVETGACQSAPEIICRFATAALEDCLRPEFSVWAWLRRTREPAIVSKNGYERARTYGSADQQKHVDSLWGLVKTRRQLDLEYCLHQLGGCWLLVHGPLAWALLVVMCEHVVMSWWYGGF